jgi:hypothetical protein
MYRFGYWYRNRYRLRYRYGSLIRNDAVTTKRLRTGASTLSKVLTTQAKQLQS